MSLLLDFYAGEPTAIGSAFSDDPDSLPSGVQHVDFSLHLSPIDLDLLTQEIQKVVGSGPTSLTESLDSQVGGDGSESSADVVSAAWVQMVAALPEDNVEDVLSVWAQAVAKEHGEPAFDVTDDLRGAVKGLVHLCAGANSSGQSIVHTWSM